jgi:hypothetical protein
MKRSCRKTWVFPSGDSHTSLKPFPVLFYFNLIELIIAIGVIGIGFAGIMSLFPVALNSTRDAIGDNYSSHVANKFLIYIARNCNDPTKKFDSGTKDFWQEYIYPASSNPMVTDESLIDESTVNFSTPPVEEGIYTSTNKSDGKQNPGLYRVEQGSSSLTITDFRATIRIWKSTVKNMCIYQKNYPEIDYAYAVNLNIEISWPSEKPYDKREKRYYTLDVFRQQF